ncbi:DUF499 domain-containing protein [Natrinema sp. 1APR25-10V2]|uniref:DUF499 domain-containing protein n=1 Tax=Natrinema sp. 1APR25-10V2 TaxID=2951081 RepID=UPI00287628DF|nr:DUF499 domain-containing protein [Natrinema sp. 1APR25-10V2]MDS0473499.1 DUF499 domain-containing protein [Natrinema sp. 1APR25-10V2]
MASADSLTRTIADTVTISRELREEGEIDGQVKLYNVDDEDEFEADASTFFDRTLMTQGLREGLVDLRDTLRGDANYGTHILYGPYGSGKSHQMVAMYHCFADPEAAGEFGDRHVDGFSDALSADENSEAITVSLQQRQPDYLWEPFFDVLDYEPSGSDLDPYPDMETIQEAVDGRTVAYLMDELEDWFEPLSGDRKKRNRGFLQAFLETADLDDSDVFAIVSVLRKGSDVHRILDRENASEVNMSSKVSKQEVIRHRLIDDIDEDAVDEIVSDYVDAYAGNDHVPDSDIPSDLAGKMRDTYPFHPVLLNALETRYYADEGNQNTRGMIYLFSKILTTAADPEADPDDEDASLLIEETDLVTHGDIDAVLFDDELTRINIDRPGVCIDDIRNRVDPDAIPYGRRILNTILLYSLKPDEGEGAGKAEIVMGTYQTGDLVSDIVLNLEQLYGVAWYLHKLNGKYAIRDRQNPNALIQNKAADVDEKIALGQIAETVEQVFGTNAYPVGFTDGDLKQVPDSRDVKVVVKSSDWTPDDVKTAIKNADGSPGREWRNTLVFVQPSGDKKIESGTGFIEKARYIEGAERVLEDDSLDDEIHSSVKRQREDEQRELRDRVELAYGEILDGDDLLNEFDLAAEMDLDVFVSEGEPLNAGDIADSVSAEGIDLQRYIWEIVEDLLDRRGEASIEDIYEQFLRQPTYPIPGSPGNVVDAAVDALEDKPVITHGSNGFSESLEGSSLDTTILNENDVQRWTAEDVVQELRQRFGSGTKAVDIGNFELELLEDTEIWLEGDGHDTVMTAAGRLAQDDQYALYSGTDIVTKAQSDATIRDISDSERIGTPEVRERIGDALEGNGRANTHRILEEIRRDETVYLPGDETERAFREAVTDFLVDDYVVDVDREYDDSLGDRDPTDVTLVPVVPDNVGDQIIDYIEGLDGGDEFTVGSVADRFDASVSEDAVQTYLLQHLGRESEPEYVIASDGSGDPTRWSPGYQFRVPSGGWRFVFNGNDVAELRRNWRQDEDSGEVTYGEVRFQLTNRMGIPGPLQGSARIKETMTKLTLESGEDFTKVRDLFERMPDEASNISVEINFE